MVDVEKNKSTNKFTGSVLPSNSDTTRDQRLGVGDFQKHHSWSLACSQQSAPDRHLRRRRWPCDRSLLNACVRTRKVLLPLPDKRALQVSSSNPKWHHGTPQSYIISLSNTYDLRVITEQSNIPLDIAITPWHRHQTHVPGWVRSTSHTTSRLARVAYIAI